MKTFVIVLWPVLKISLQAIEYFIPLTIIVSCYIAIALRFIIKKSKLGLINAMRSSSHCVLLAISFVFTFSPVNIHKTLDWYQYLIDGKSFCFVAFHADF